MVSNLSRDEDEYDLCIVGAGPAGLVIASELAYTGLRICVLESGGERRSTSANAVKEVLSLEQGLPIKSETCERVLGGAGTVWGGFQRHSMISITNPARGAMVGR